MRQLFPRPSAELSDVDLARLYSSGPAPEGSEPRVRLNAVSTVDGAAAGPDGLSGSIGSPADRRVFDVLRAWADVVLVGRGTYVAEGYSALRTRDDLASYRVGRAPHPHLAVLTSSPLAAQAAESGRGAVFAVAGALHDVISGLREDGMTRVLCEGGPHLASSMLAAGLVDELCTTTTPMTLSGNAIRTLSGTAHRSDLELVSLLEQDSTLVARWRVTTAQ
ncbi:dihydrofolate reductase family protein [Allobranchiibius sp. CTAmp26]|uniref:dihydrofolate reductase family protein n=1 Tax=Allobranchiibius sp. CTAmp26 TaxID=2815214 RepID=UPI001AA1AED8|nr:dihydrofolate reductase family protein [Allobranchiibius sp. CTAmp26]MBO1755552.1 dihydrofolate reductase family protein [Allobranchiibius sp. CTAmp26]